MHQQVAVGVGHGVGQLQEEMQALSQRQGLYRFIDRLALHVLQHEVGQALFAGTGVQQARDVRVAQARQRLALLGKALQHGGAVHAAFQELDSGATLVAAVAAARLEDLTHAAGADGPYHLPCAQSLADSGSLAWHRGQCDGSVFGHEYRAAGGLVVVGQQAAQFGHASGVSTSLNLSLEACTRPPEAMIFATVSSGRSLSTISLPMKALLPQSATAAIDSTTALPPLATDEPTPVVRTVIRLIVSRLCTVVIALRA